ncbi:hypothetical protein ABE82_26065 (plasmid) [Paenibacillus peoriae]|uniref:GNAT family N-acetyltransferase n=1 Tax=Paenibacillus peoriae TaxID=59893 RepID=UPI0007211D6C|nr:GNAT family N-acetyltransferase [Paenibacillus peoriae]ALS09887.1 hypothetical protein ABE82_26065 [Paenibacillus peoriae]
MDWPFVWTLFLGVAMIIVLKKIRNKRCDPAGLTHVFLTTIMYLIVGVQITYILIKLGGTSVTDFYDELKNDGFFNWYIPYVFIAVTLMVTWLVYTHNKEKRNSEIVSILKGVRDKMNALDDIQSYHELLEIMEQDAGNRLKVRLKHGRLEVEDDRQRVDLYLRLTPTLIEISRIKVANPRTGVGTKMLEWIKKFAIENEIYHIRIGIGETEAVQAFAQKHGFVLAQDELPAKNWNLRLEGEL